MTNNDNGLAMTGPLLGDRQGFDQKEEDSEESPVPSSLVTLFLVGFWGCCGPPRGGFEELWPKCWAVVWDYSRLCYSFTLNLGRSTSLVWVLFTLEKGDIGLKKQALVSFGIGKVNQTKARNVCLF